MQISIVSIITFLCLAFSTNALAGSEPSKKPIIRHIKCWIITKDGNQHIKTFQLKKGQKVQSADIKKFKKRLKKQSIYKPDGLRKSKIKTVKECVPANTEFKKQQAKKLEKKYPQ